MARSQSQKKQYLDSLKNLSTVDGRECLFTVGLRRFFSEAALHRYRAVVAIELLIALSESEFPHRPTISDVQKESIRSWVDPEVFDSSAVAEYDHFGRKGTPATEHDVKAVELALREKAHLAGLDHVMEMLSFPMTSEDENNIAWNFMIRDAINEVWIPALLKLMDQLQILAKKYADIPVVGRTHGVKASPTTIGKRFAYFLSELTEALQYLCRCQLDAKFSGPVGNHNAMTALAPEFDMDAFAQSFVQSFGMVYAVTAHQRNSHQGVMRLFHAVSAVNQILEDLAEHLRLSVMMGYLSLVAVKGQVGSSVMPHKVNPWRAEVAQGYLEQANTQIHGMQRSLGVSWFERDLTDHPAERVYGEVFGKSLIGIQYLIQGLNAVKVQKKYCRRELRNSPEVLAEAVQIAGRMVGMPNAYMQLKDATRGKKVTLEGLREIVRQHVTDAGLRGRLLALEPESYVGIAAMQARKEAAQYEGLRMIFARGILSKLQQIRAVLWDFDGTLQIGDKAELIARLAAISEQMQLKFTSEEIQEFANRSDYREMRKLMVDEYNDRMRKLPIEEQLPVAPYREADFQVVNDRVSGDFDDRFELAPGARELLEAFQERGIRQGIVTTRGSKSLMRLLDRHGIKSFFEVIVDRDSCIQRKPHPQPIRVALRMLDIQNSAQALYIGDLQTDDVIAGNAALVCTALVTKTPLDPQGAIPHIRATSLSNLAWHLFGRRA